MTNLAPQFRQLSELLKNAKSVLIATHENPDIDGIGSALAIDRLCKVLGTKSFVYAPGGIIAGLSFLPGFYRVAAELKQDNFDLAFCLDYGDFMRLRLPEDLQINTLVTIDHHPKSSQRGDICLIAEAYSSCAEIVYHWFRSAGFPIDKDVATCLLAGIVADTGGFRHVSTSPRTLKAASELALRGASVAGIVKKVITLQNSSVASKIAGRILSRVSLDSKSRLTYSWATLNEVKQAASENFSLQEIPTIISAASPINFGLFLSECEDNFVRGSFRSEPHTGIDVNVLAGLLGGGGHIYAAGFRYQGTIKETLQKVLELLE